MNQRNSISNINSPLALGEVRTYEQKFLDDLNSEEIIFKNRIASDTATASLCTNEIFEKNSELEKLKPLVNTAQLNVDAHKRELKQKYYKNKQAYNVQNSQPDGISFFIEITTCPWEDDNELRVLQSKLSVLKKQKENLMNSIKLAEDRIKEYELRIDNHSNSLNQINIKKTDVITFLQSIQNSPADLFHKISTSILESLQKYDSNNPANQSCITRLCLHRLPEKLNAIRDYALNREVNKAWQIRYAILCGFLEKMYKTTAKDNIALANEVLLLLHLTHIHNESDLPDNAATGYLVSQQFEDFSKYADSSLFLTVDNQERLNVFEKDEYEGAINDLKQSINIVSNSEIKLQAKRTQLAIEKDLELSATKASNYKRDYKFAIKCLCATSQYVAKQDDVTAKEVKRLSEYAPRSNFAKQAGGLLLAVAGILLISAAIAAAVATFGISTPLSALAAAVGSTMVAQGIAFGSMAIGGVMTFGGLGIFRKNQRSGVYKAMQEMAIGTRQPSTLTPENAGFIHEEPSAPSPLQV